jgi:hypothetical protein
MFHNDFSGLRKFAYKISHQRVLTKHKTDKITQRRVFLFDCALTGCRGLGYLSRYIDELRVGRPGFDAWQGQGIFIFTASGPSLGSTHAIQWAPEAIFPGVKRPEREADHYPLSNAVELYFQSLYVFMALRLIN